MGIGALRLDSQRLVQVPEGLLEPLQVQVNQPAIEVAVVLARPKSYRLAVISERLFMAALAEEDRTPVEVGPGEAGIESDRLVVARERLLRVVEVMAGLAVAQMGLGIQWIEAQGPLEMSHGVRVVARPEALEAPLAEDLRFLDAALWSHSADRLFLHGCYP